MDFSCLNVSGTSTARMTTVSPTIASPQLPPTAWSWMNTMTDSNALMSGENASSMALVARIGMRAVGRAVRRAAVKNVGGRSRLDDYRCGRASRLAALLAPEHPLRLDRIVSAVAPRIAPQQPPPGQHETAQKAIPPDRLDGVARARRLVLAAPRKRRRDEPL